MLKEVGECLQSLCKILDNIQNPTIATRLTNIESKLVSIEKELHRQSSFALYIFIYALSLSAISIGLAIRVEHPFNGLVLMSSGLALIVLSSIIEITRLFFRKIRVKEH